jgi:hypothetical protein
MGIKIFILSLKPVGIYYLQVQYLINACVILSKALKNHLNLPMTKNFTFNDEDLNYSNEDKDFSSVANQSVPQTLEPSKACIHRILAYAHAYQSFQSERIGKIELLLN